MFPLPQIPLFTSHEFRDFVARVTANEFIEALAQECKLSPTLLHERMVQAVAESAQTLRLLAGVQTADGDRIIEIGAGLGVTSAFLATSGFDVTALEPGAVGFEENRMISRQFANLLGSEHDVLSIGATDLDTSTHGRFALAFSNNVLEHIDDPATALRALAKVMTDDGLIVNSCPNYSVPYEPHFGVPLLPGKPRWTARVLPRSISRSSLWKSLNFIRSRDVVRVGADLGLGVRFRSATLATSLQRLLIEPEFRSRHRILGLGAGVARSCGLFSLLRRLPPTWSTPMDFIMYHPSADQARIECWLRRGGPTTVLKRRLRPARLGLP